MLLRRLLIILGLLVGIGLLAACGRGRDPSPTEPASTPVGELATPTVTQAPPRTLTICLGQEPPSLYPVGNVSSAARSVLAAVYDGPIDSLGYEHQPVILQRLPSLENGDAAIEVVSVYVGDEVVDADGLPVTLAPGVRVRPAGCRSDACAITFDGTAEIQMDQMVVNFMLLPDLQWSDGVPLTAEDSAYSFSLSASPQTRVSKYLVDRTQSYEAVDNLTAQWWGKPGYIDPTYFLNFWTPYPRHLWASFSPEELADTDVASLTPTGWGPYIIQEWVDGEHIALSRNPLYFRTGEGLPKFEFLTFRFTPDPEAAISALLAGQCDLLDPSVHLEGQVALLRSMAEQEQLQALFTTTAVMEQLAFGIRPASYDYGYTAGIDRPDFFSDRRVRQAVALCIDRQAVVANVLYGLSSVPDSFLPADHPLFNPQVTHYGYDLAAASQLLEQAGWRDVDNDPATPRQAWGVQNILAGTAFTVNYYTTGAAQRIQVATLIAESLTACGIQVNVQYLEATTLYASGPEGFLFGRNFDLAEFAMGSTATEMPCTWLTSAEVPAVVNNWVGTNLSGYINPAYDEACRLAEQSLPGETAQVTGFQDTQAIFAQEVPILPLYWRLKVAAARPDLCHYDLDPSTVSELWNLEMFDYGLACGE